MSQPGPPGTVGRATLLRLAQQSLALARRRGHCVGLVHVRLDPGGIGAQRASALAPLAGAAAACIRSILRDSDSVACEAAHEILILLPEMWDVEGAARVALRVSEGLTALMAGLRGEQRCAVGVVLAPDDGRTFDQLARNAMAASLRALEQGVAFEFYRAELSRSSREHLLLERDLNSAPERDQFVLRYQPIVELSSGRVAGLEALTYWPHFERGVVPPLQFLPIAERSGRIVSIDRWAVSSALRHVSGYFGSSNRGWIAVNFSARTLHHPDIVSHVASALDTHRVAPERLVIEVTESTAMSEPDSSARALGRLKSLGLKVALDDFGSGYSSLGYLRHLPIDILKLDKVFARDIGNDRRCERLIESVIGLAHGMGLTMLAEGVETPLQWNWLRSKGCDLVQGFLFSPPTALENLVYLPNPAKLREAGINIVA